MAQNEADYRNRQEMQRRGIAISKVDGKYKGRSRTADYADARAWRVENGATIRPTAEHFGIALATAKRACSEEQLAERE